ncbi:ATP-binding cassette domain-containing protein [Luteimicrobium xylanilyticum]|uniref:Polar-amino-acid-transporting ATPase n=1 Tax=Luteimicrobium xylanilyticum TaxID=1133546 RepID=A0A5P9Q6I1_9MICO|nr:ATP-binding cassette domain-containing protein [Luteimicrobium xylanilyticum]QFU97001.1 Polar-amino-acid-transporting ATPase [Luteimicrobium xylanilyticum]
MISFENVSKRYGGFTAVDDVSFVARSGRVTGFLGPNGAGKSTSMRIMAGLTLPDRGVATIGGHRYADIPNPGRHVGILLDASAQHAGRTGREVLTITAMTMGLPESHVDEMLETVGLTPAEAKRRVKNYSLGMRQRLGIANALIGKPSVLILDEPANGLDPAGIHWMRGLLRDFAAEGGTVLLSSHLLHEVEMIADDMVLIGRGKIVAQGAKHELLRTAGTFARAEDPALLAKVLADAGISAAPSGDGGLRTEAEPVAIGRAAAAAGVVLVELRPAEGAGLEEMFLQLTASDARETVTHEGAAA